MIEIGVTTVIRAVAVMCHVLDEGEVGLGLRHNQMQNGIILYFAWEAIRFIRSNIE